MRIKYSGSILLLISILLVRNSNAAVCLIPLLCSTSSSDIATSIIPEPTSAGPVTAIPTSAVNSGGYSSSAVPSTVGPTVIPSTVSNHPASATHHVSNPTTSMDGDVVYPATSNLPTTTSLPTTETKKSSSGNNNLPIIIGSVCGFVGLLIIGFLFAFCCKTRKNKKRLYSESGDIDNYQNDIFSNTTPVTAVAAVGTINNNSNNNGQWDMMDQQQHYYNQNMVTPQLPMTMAPTSQDPYYTTASPQMSYVDPAANYYNQPGYYDPNMAYYQQPYMDPQQYNQMTISSTMAPAIAPATTPTVYSSPNSYPEDHEKFGITITSANKK